ncbi:MAG TPA: endonuclease III [Syntrophorhabdaceae bacterium]|nr:endonuclease III [Syntrophorhabdaceae bacterium]
MIRILQQLFLDDVPAVTRISQRENRDPFLVLIGTLLSLRTKDNVTEKALAALSGKARTPQQMIRIPETQLQKLIYPVGFYRNKSRVLRGVAQTLIEKYNGTVPDSMDELLSIKGVGRKTANLVMNEAFGKPGICVDTHVHRVSNRMGIVSTRNPHETERALEKILPLEYWIIYNTLLVTFGQKICKPVSPVCSTCPLSSMCKKTGVTRNR